MKKIIGILIFLIINSYAADNCSLNYDQRMLLEHITHLSPSSLSLSPKPSNFFEKALAISSLNDLESKKEKYEIIRQHLRNMVRLIQNSSRHDDGSLTRASAIITSLLVVDSFKCDTKKLSIPSSLFKPILQQMINDNTILLAAKKEAHKERVRKLFALKNLQQRQQIAPINEQQFNIWYAQHMEQKISAMKKTIMQQSILEVPSLEPLALVIFNDEKMEALIRVSAGTTVAVLLNSLREFE